jgi:uncharacterized protein YndB with AHSA1/START domain
MTKSFQHQLQRTITIGAPREMVFRYFTDNAHWAAWWGKGSTIEPRVGGRVFIRHPEGTEVVGDVVAIDPPERIVFTYGYVKGTPVAPGESQVTIRLDATARGTRLNLLHEFADEAAMHPHVQGWRYQLSLFANVVSNEVHASAADVVDRWFATWSNPDAASRERDLAQLVAESISMRDRFSAIDGVDDVRAHLAAVHKFMPGFRLVRDGDVKQCQGMVLAPWRAEGADGTPRGAGTNVFVLSADGRIEAVTGFWA